MSQPPNLIAADEASTTLQKQLAEVIAAAGVDPFCALDACTKQVAALLSEIAPKSRRQRRELADLHHHLIQSLANDLTRRPPSGAVPPTKPWLN